MPDPGRPYLPAFARIPPPRIAGDALVLCVGSRGVVRADGSKGSVTLMSEDGLTSLATLSDGVEVEIVAWRPRRAGGTMYCVRQTSGVAEGWVAAVSLRPHPIPARPKPTPARPKPPVQSKASAAKASVVKASVAKASVAKASMAAAKSAKRPAKSRAAL